MMLSSFRTTAASLARRESHERAQNTIGECRARVAAHGRPCYTSANSTAPVRLGFHAERRALMKRFLASFALAALLMPALASAHDNHVVRIVAGSPGYDH